MLRLKEEDEEHILLKHKLYASIGPLAHYCHVEAIHRNMLSTPIGRAQLGSFRLHLKAMAEKRSGKPNAANGWYGAPKDSVRRILNDGFSVGGRPEDCNPYGYGLYLSSDKSVMHSVMSSTDDEDGVRHVLFCRMILGNVEEVPPGSKQFCPSSGEFDSGVDNQQSPTKYIAWYPDVRTHILPIYVLSIKLDFCSRGLKREPVKRPSSPWMPFNALISVLSKSLPHSTVCLIRKFHSDYMGRKIDRKQLIRHVRELSGDNILISAIKSFREKGLKAGSASVLRMV